MIMHESEPDPPEPEEPEDDLLPEDVEEDFPPTGRLPDGRLTYDCPPTVAAFFKGAGITQPK